MSKNPYKVNFHVSNSNKPGTDSIPPGLATIWTTNNGWVGSNNGYPSGQPALFKAEQAEAIAGSVNLVAWLGRESVLALFANPGAVPAEFWDYFGWDKPSEEEIESSDNTVTIGDRPGLIGQAISIWQCREKEDCDPEFWRSAGLKLAERIIKAVGLK